MYKPATRRFLFPLLGALGLAALPWAERVDAQAQPRPAAATTAAPLRVMTFNVRYNNPGDSLDAWPHRREGVAGLIRFHDPDLVGLQEPQRNQLDDLQRLLPEYAWFGLPRADGNPRDEYSAILYRTDRLELLSQGTFWLSETPDVPASRGWDTSLPRIATWGRFRDRTTGDTILHVNTHFDHIGVRAREESARLVKRWLAADGAGLPVVLTGDFNTPPGSAPIQLLLDASTPPRLNDAISVSAEPPYGPSSTWNGFQAIEPERRIDFVFVGDRVRVLEHGTLAETLDGRHFPSDHLPVMAEIVVTR
jgi:endonuclease/exonuclease/phosphatase family metal-dependent hydrolase